MDLGPGQLVRMDALHGCIEVAHGCLWLTVEGEPQDRFMTAGDSQSLSGQPVVLGTSSAARVRLVAGGAVERTALGRGWQRLVRETRRQVQRLQFGPGAVQTWT
jgi:hypothetical protein